MNHALVSKVVTSLKSGQREYQILQALSASGVPKTEAKELLARAALLVVNTEASPRRTALKAPPRRVLEQGSARSIGVRLMSKGMVSLVLGLALTLATGGHGVFYGAIAVGLAFTAGGGIVTLTGRRTVLGLPLY